MSNELVKQENVEMIVKNAPQSYNENQISHDRCIETGKKLLADIQAAGGMNDELDQRAAEFINRARNTVKKMNDKRSPITKLFDEIRTVFTSMENDVDPTKAESVPGKLQKMRNDYAAKREPKLKLAVVKKHFANKSKLQRIDTVLQWKKTTSNLSIVC